MNEEAEMLRVPVAMAMTKLLLTLPESSLYQSRVSEGYCERDGVRVYSVHGVYFPGLFCMRIKCATVCNRFVIISVRVYQCFFVIKYRSC